MELNITSEVIKAAIPNVVNETTGESSLVTKLKPWLDDATAWLFKEFVGEGFILPEDLVPLAQSLVINKAFADAIPSLDVALTPAGFAVISTQGRAPASKERIERLIGQLRLTADHLCGRLLRMLASVDRWRTSYIGRYWRGTCMTLLEDLPRFRTSDDILADYHALRDIVAGFEIELETDYLGRGIIQLAHEADEAMPGNEAATTVRHMIRRASLRYVEAKYAGIASVPYHPWAVAREILDFIRRTPKLHEVWAAEMSDYVRVDDFENKSKGGYFF